MEGYEKYQVLMADWAKDFMLPFAKAKPLKPMPEASRAFLNKLFYGFTEISATYDALELSRLLVQLAPPRSKRIKRDDYLKYHINAYLQETYILKERLKSYVKVLQRCYRNTSQQKTFEKFTDGLVETAIRGFGGLVDTRGKHVHRQRYSDFDLHQVTALSLLASFDDKLIEDAKFEYKWASRKWANQIKENNKVTLSILDAYFELMRHAVTKNGEVFVPKSSRPKAV